MTETRSVKIPAELLAQIARSTRAMIDEVTAKLARPDLTGAERMMLRVDLVELQETLERVEREL
ncbi:MAG: hypothetical protein ACK5VI_01785 [Opitutia bacterium]